MFCVMRNAGFILVLLIALVVGVVASIQASAQSDAYSQTASRDESTGPYNPNLPAPDALPRRGA
jgi:hypothetical protein